MKSLAARLAARADGRADVSANATAIEIIECRRMCVEFMNLPIELKCAMNFSGFYYMSRLVRLNISKLALDDNAI